MSLQWPLTLIKSQLSEHGAGVEADKLMCATAGTFIIMPINKDSSLPFSEKLASSFSLVSVFSFLHVWTPC